MADRRVTFTELAQVLGTSVPYVSKLKKSGRLVLTDDGRACWMDASLARIEATRDPSAINPAGRGGQASVAVSSAPDDDDADESVVGRPDYQEARARREHYNAELARMTYEKEVGRLIEVDMVREVILGGVTAMRSRLEQLGEKHGIQGDIEYALTDLERHFARKLGGSA